MTDKELRSEMDRSVENGQRMIFDEYCGYVYAICANRLRNIGTNEDIEECVSDVFAAVFRHFDNPADKNGDIKGIIGTIAKRHAIDFFRRLSRRYGKTVPIDDELSAVLQSEQRVDDAAEKAAVCKTILNCVERLGEPDSSIIAFHYYYGKTSKQIASLVGLSEAAVQKRMSRAREKLKKLFIEAGISEEG